jgi:hypothetical protein
MIVPATERGGPMPEKTLTAQVHWRVTPEDLEALDWLVKKLGGGQSNVLRRLVVERAKQEGWQPEAKQREAAASKPA